MPLERRDVESALEKKGFVSQQGDHRYFIYHTVAGKKTSVWTKTSHGTGHKTLSDNLVSALAKQCGLTAAQFKQLVACPLTREELEQILVDVGRIKAQ
jgi:predicted transcriptional regulator